MNQTLKLDQNDISLIIGNLPKRLQQKIADETGTSHQLLHAAAGGKGRTCLSKEPDVGLATKPLLKDNRCNDGRRSDVAEIVSQSAGSPGLPIKFKNVTKPSQSGLAFQLGPGILRLNHASVKADAGRQSPTEPLPNTQSPSHSCVKLAKFNTPLWLNALAKRNALQAKSLADLLSAYFELSEAQQVIEQWLSFCKIHKDLQQLFAELLLEQLKFCCEEKVDHYFWKLLYYNVIEYLKDNENNQQHPACDHQLYIIDSGLKFYKSLLEALTEQQAKKDKRRKVNNEEEQQQKQSTLQKVLGQKMLICIGDLCRYKSKRLQSNDYAEAAEYYERAQKLLPNNGIPYNKLAVLSIYQRKTLDIIHYHMRSLMSSNAIYSARESLQIMFEDIRRKFETNELKASPLRLMSRREQNRTANALRREIWIRPDGLRRVHWTDINDASSTLVEENRWRNMSADELLHRFTSLYLYVIGKLFTGIGMETVQEHQRKLLILLKVLLAQQPLIISANRLLKIVALNIFVMEQNKRKEARREIRYYAFVFCNQIFGLLLHKFNELYVKAKMTTEVADVKVFCCGKDFWCNMEAQTILKFVRIWCEWLLRSVNIWEPIRCEDYIRVNTWAELQLAFEHINQVLSTLPANTNNLSTQATLDEDIFLMGFNPVSLANKLLSINDVKVSPSEIQNIVRLKKVYEFKMDFAQHENRLIDMTPSESFCLEDVDAELLNKEDASTISQKDEQPVKTDIEDLPVSELAKLKRELEAKSNAKKMYDAKLEEIVKLVHSKLYIEVRPKYLMPDTNCFIDCLEDFEKLVTQNYILMVPLTVVRELEGLSKGVKIESWQNLSEDRIHHFDEVSTRAKLSLDFINTGNVNVRCVTSKGSVISASLFGLVEEEHMSNDDRILATALALSKTLSYENNEDGKHFINTLLVLITTDRNLRVKALARNLAVSELSEFQLWASGCNDKCN